MNKRDRIPNYILRNALATFLAAFIAFGISIVQYYQCSMVEMVQRIFAVNTYTTLYFLLIWLLNYMIFEISKILYDAYRQKLLYYPCIALIILAVIIYLIPMLDLFKYDLILLCLIIILRVIKEMIKKRPNNV